MLSSPGISMIQPPLYPVAKCPLYFTGFCVLLFALSFHTTRIYINLSVCYLVGMYDDGDINETHTSYIPTAKKKPIIICGDFNVAAMPIDLKNPKSNVGNAGFTPEEREKFQKLLQSGFVDTYRYMHPDKQEFSWWSYMRHARERNIGWRLDYFLLSEFAKDKIVDAKILTDIHGSDHAPVSLEIDI